MSQLSLRARLLIGLVTLTVIALAIAGLVTYEEQHSFLLTRVDQQVGDSRIPVSVAQSGPAHRASAGEIA